MQVSASLVLIQLANCQKEQVFSQIDNILSRVSMAPCLRDKQILYRSAMKMLFGFGSFEQLYSETQLVCTCALIQWTLYPYLSMQATRPMPCMVPISTTVDQLTQPPCNRIPRRYYSPHWHSPNKCYPTCNWHTSYHTRHTSCASPNHSCRSYP